MDYDNHDGLRYDYNKRNMYCSFWGWDRGMAHIFHGETWPFWWDNDDKPWGCPIFVRTYIIVCDRLWSSEIWAARKIYLDQDHPTLGFRYSRMIHGHANHQQDKIKKTVRWFPIVFPVNMTNTEVVAMLRGTGPLISKLLKEDRGGQVGIHVAGDGWSWTDLVVFIVLNYMLNYRQL